MLVLFGLLLLLVLSQPLADWLIRKPAADFSGFEREMEVLQRSGLPGEANQPGSGNTANPGTAMTAGTGSAAGMPAPEKPLFPFDPNTVTMEDLLKLGLEKRVANTLLNYREAGGVFDKTEDLKKIYGLREALYERLRPFIRIQQPEGSQANPFHSTGITRPKTPSKRGRTTPSAGKRAGVIPSPGKRRRGSPSTGNRPREPAFIVEINTADSASLLPLPGVGPVLSARIVKYRERLGGFHSADQLLEVYGLDTADFKRFRSRLQVNTALVKKIDLNAAGYEELRRLPYWSPSQINTLLNYRGQHGDFSELGELANIRVLEDHIIQKVMPYLSLE